MEQLSARYGNAADHFAVRDASFHVAPGEVFGVVGESGSGKSTLVHSVLRLLPPGAVVEAGCVQFMGHDLLSLGERELRAIRGRDIAMIFQQPMRSLHPAFTVGWQLREALAAHRGIRRADADARAAELLGWVGIGDPQRRLKAFPHELSGGMQQRVMIAMALINDPALLLADEPTTALDVTIQAQILALLRRTADERGLAVVLVTHNLGVVASICDRMIVMLGGEVVEQGDVAEIFERPTHPYTQALLDALPERATGDRLPVPDHVAAPR